MRDHTDDVCTIAEVAAHLRARNRRDYRLAATRELPALKLEREGHFPRAEIDYLMANGIGEVAVEYPQGGEE